MNHPTMKTYFFGAYQKETIARSNPETTTVEGLENLIEADVQYRYDAQDGTCLAWGNFYDTETTAKALGLGKDSNPAELIYLVVAKNGPESLADIYGEFTCMILQNERLILARDLVGAGVPVFYSDLYFSTNIDDFKRIKGFSPQPDPEGIAEFLHLGTPMPPKTVLKNIHVLAPGEYLVFEKDVISVKNIFPFEKYEELFASQNISENEATEELERLHKAAIKRRIANRENVSLLMSGGYDSGGNVAALRNLYNGKVNGYSIGFKGDAWSELPLAALLAKKFDIDFHDYEIDGSEIEELPVILGELGYPFQENGIMVNYCVMRRVSKDHNDIILGGDGNDQVYGTAIQQIALHYYMLKYGIKPFQKIIAGLTNGSNSRLLSRVNFHNNRILHAADYSSFGFSKSDIRKFFKTEIQKPRTNVLKMHHLKAKSFDELFKVHTYFKDFEHDGNNLIIFKASNMARLFGQRLSFPYMDTDSIRFVFSLPRACRFSGSVKEIAKGHGKGKYLHKKYLEPKLPPEITQRKKQGGFAPLPIFFKDAERRQMVYGIIRNSTLYKDLFHTNLIEDFIREYEGMVNQPNAWFWHQQSMAFRIFNLLTLTVWWDIHVNNKTSDSLRQFGG